MIFFDYKINLINFFNFQENDIIQLITKVDDNWFEGKVNGIQGN